MTTSVAATPGPGLGDRIYRKLSDIPTAVLWLLVVIWTIPSLSLFVNSFRGRDAQRNDAFWNILAERDATLENYESVLTAGATNNLTDSIVTSFAIAVPATIIPITFAAIAAYAFAWMDFRGKKWLFIGTVSLLAIPLQVALIPLLQLFGDGDPFGGAHLTVPFTDKTLTVLPLNNLVGTPAAVWLTHTGFAMPFAIFLLHNYIVQLPKELFESAQIDGANHFGIFWRLVLPLSIPALASFAIFQFLWTWNDYLIANTMLGFSGQAPTTVFIANLAGDFDNTDHLLTSAAFVQAFFPLVVFFSLQRYFVRGILAGSVKG